MKLWTTVELERLPKILQQGFDNPFSDEILFWNDKEIGAEQAMSFEGELAFIEAEFPDDQLENYFTYCLGSTGDHLSDMEVDIERREEEGADPSEIAELRKAIKKGSEIESAKDSLDFFGYACLAEVLPPATLKLLNLEQTMEAMQTGDKEIIEHAIDTAEATPFKSLSASFWVWLIMVMSQIFGPGHGLPEPTEAQEAAREAQEGQLETMRRKASKRPRKKAYKAKKAVKR